MEFIEKEVKNILEAQGIYQPKEISKDDYATLIFKVQCPITGEVIKNYEFTRSNYYKLALYVQKRLQKLASEESFDEKAYNQANLGIPEKIKKYNSVFEKTYNEVIEEKGITKKDIEKANNIIEAIILYAIDREDINDECFFIIEKTIIKEVKKEK